MKSSQLRALRSIALQNRTICRQCRQFSVQRVLSQQASPNRSKPPSQPNLPPVNRPAPDRQLAPERIRKDFIPEPIGAPIGFTESPLSSQDWFQLERAGNTALERNVARRKILLKKFDKSYFRDFRNMDSNRGKFYLANERLYRKDVSLYFPNLVGRNLARSLKDTTSVLKGKISVVTIFSRKWAEDQAQTFVSEKENPELLQAIQESGGAAQLIEINHEEFRMSSAMLWLFEWNMKRNRSTEQQDRYFIMRGLPQTVKDSIGIMNDKIGYVFLLDRNCKIRWSACADALDSEKDSLVKGIQKLLVEGRG